MSNVSNLTNYYNDMLPYMVPEHDQHDRPTGRILWPNGVITGDQPPPRELTVGGQTYTVVWDGSMKSLDGITGTPLRKSR